MSKQANSDDQAMRAIERNRLVELCDKLFEFYETNGPYGTMWLAYFPADLEESNFGLGLTKNEALDDLLELELS